MIASLELDLEQCHLKSFRALCSNYFSLSSHTKKFQSLLLLKHKERTELYFNPVAAIRLLAGRFTMKRAIEYRN